MGLFSDLESVWEGSSGRFSDGGWTGPRFPGPGPVGGGVGAGPWDRAAGGRGRDQLQVWSEQE